MSQERPQCIVCHSVHARLHAVGEDSQTISVKTISQPPTHSLKGLILQVSVNQTCPNLLHPDDLILRVLPLQSMRGTSELWAPSLSGVEIFTTAHTQFLKIWL